MIGTRQLLRRGATRGAPAAPPMNSRRRICDPLRRLREPIAIGGAARSVSGHPPS
jgi:hypothetical protein